MGNDTGIKLSKTVRMKGGVNFGRYLSMSKTHRETGSIFNAGKEMIKGIVESGRSLREAFAGSNELGVLYAEREKDERLKRKCSAAVRRHRLRKPKSYLVEKRIRVKNNKNYKKWVESDEGVKNDERG